MRGQGRLGELSFEQMLDNDPQRGLDYWERIHAKLTVDIKALNAVKHRSPIQNKELAEKRANRRYAAHMIAGFQQRLEGF